MDYILRDELNEKQYEAASKLEGPLLIIAGAGSGKTRMITYRIANMLKNNIPQSSILALTFTNKAASEMAERIRTLSGKRLSNLTVSTFHAFGVKILRKCIHNLGYKDNFSIYDQVDKITLIKEAARIHKYPPEALDIFFLSNLFSAIKTKRAVWDGTNDQYKELFIEYEEHLKVYNAVDFDDLIIKPIELFTGFPETLEKYNNRYKYIMVDEFQDTSLCQYTLMKLLAEKSRNICVVGDDDQSIYSWRGANYQNIINFEGDFSERLEIKLEQNYRSTKNILTAANGLISHNMDRKEKKLWTGTGEGHSIEIFYPENDFREGEFISEMIKSRIIKEGMKYHDIGVLVRTNSLTASIENAFLSENIPYKVSGGTSFFQRKEIKDIAAYLRIIANPDDDVNILRIINTPRRGIGKKSLQTIRDIAEEKSYSLYSAISAMRWASDSPVSDKVKRNLEEFLTMIEYYRERILSGKNMTETIRSLVETIDYWGYLLQEHQKNDKIAKWKFKNINLFIDFFENWEKDPDNVKPDIFKFLNRISLITRDDNNEDESGKVNLMTIHSAKGLEFDLVFLAGVEDGIIPHARSLEEDPKNVEEERRLFYVAITRAKQKLYMTSCRTRKVMREIAECVPSPFLLEIPEGLVEFHQAEDDVNTDEAFDYFARIKNKMKQV